MLRMANNLFEAMLSMGQQINRASMGSPGFSGNSRPNNLGRMVNLENITGKKAKAFAGKIGGMIQLGSLFEESDEEDREEYAPSEKQKEPEKVNPVVCEQKEPEKEPAVHKFSGKSREELQEAVIWAEILGEPLAKRRRRERMRQYYGNQGYVGRR